MKYSSRFFLYAPLIAFLALAGWAMAHWWAVAGALDKKLTAMNDHEAVPGITLHYASKTISGFPFNIDVVFTGLRISGAGAHGPFSWTTERFAMHALTYGRAQEIFEAAGQQNLSWTNSDGGNVSLKFLPGSLRASSIADANGLSRFDLDIIAADGKEKGARPPFVAGRLQFHMRRNPDGHDLDLMASADKLMVGAGNFDSGIETLRLYATLTQASAFAPVLRGEEPLPNADARWRAQGGILKPDQQKTAVKLIGVGSESQSASDFAVILKPLY